MPKVGTYIYAYTCYVWSYKSVNINCNFDIDTEKSCYISYVYYVENVKRHRENDMIEM